MSRKFWVGWLILTFMLGSLNIFWSKPAQANTEEKRRECVCAAEPWHNDFFHSGNPTPLDTSALGAAQNQVKLPNAEQSSTPNRVYSRDRNLFHRILQKIWGVIFLESF